MLRLMLPLFWTIVLAWLAYCQESNTDDDALTLKRRNKVGDWAIKLSKQLVQIGNDATQVAEVEKKFFFDNLTREFVLYSNVPVEDLNMENIMTDMADEITAYMNKRSEYAEKLKMNVQAKELEDPTSNETKYNDYNNPIPDRFVRYYDANTGNDGFCCNTDYGEEVMNKEMSEELCDFCTCTYVNETNTPELSTTWALSGQDVTYNVDFVHVPVPVYKRGRDLLRKVKWSQTTFADEAKQYPAKDASLRSNFLAFCSETGFMRFLPGKRWRPFGPKGVHDSGDLPDLYDCRTTSWYINAVTNPKNIIILLDQSGSMLGQSNEISKQLIEEILGTLSENDFFNIIWFNDEAHFLEHECYNDTLIQATLRNKRLLRAKLENVTWVDRGHLMNMKDGPSGTSKPELAFLKAFETLRNVRFPANWTDWFQHMQKTSDPGQRTAPAPFDEELRALLNSSDVGCNSAILLISDGLADTHEHIWRRLNKDRKVRVFTYLIGEEAVDFKELEWIACHNDGYMTHVQNLADVSEKTKFFIEVMSRPVARYEGIDGKKSPPFWSGIFMDHMSRRLATAVSYPVIGNDMQQVRIHKDHSKQWLPTVLGATAVVVPMVELMQRAPIWKLGRNSYTFMTDNNGYVMWHPQHRPTTSDGRWKPNYNSVDILEAEPPVGNSINRTEMVPLKGDNLQVPEAKELSGEIADEKTQSNTNDIKLAIVNRTLDYNEPLRKALVGMESSKNSAPIERVVYLALTEKGKITRAYEQTNRYYYRGLNDVAGANFSLGIAVPVGEKGATKRISTGGFKWQDFNIRWLDGTNWSAHPDWKYCYYPTRSNNNDGSKKAMETELYDLVKMSKEDNKLNANCQQDNSEEPRELLERFLFDAKVTEALDAKWTSSFKKDSAQGVHLIWLATQNGLTRFAMTEMEGILKHVPFDAVVNETEEATSEKPIEFVTVKSTHKKKKIKVSTKASQKHKPRLNPVPYKEEEKKLKPGEQSYTHFIRSHSRAVHELFYQQAMLYGPGEETYVFNIDTDNMMFYEEAKQYVDGSNRSYSLLLTVSRAVYHQEAPVGVVGFEMLHDRLGEMMHEISQGECYGSETLCFLVDENGYVVYSSLRNTTNQHGQTTVVAFQGFQGNETGKRFLGNFMGPEKWMMNDFKESGVYQDFAYVDYQAYDGCNAAVREVSAGCRLRSPFYILISWLRYLWKELYLWIVEYSFWSVLHNFLMPIEAYTDIFQGRSDPMPCDQAGILFQLNRTKLKEKMDGRTSTKFYTQSSCLAACKTTGFAAPIKGTNLVLAVLYMKAYDPNSGMKDVAYCHDSSLCEHNWFHSIKYGFTEVTQASDKALPGYLDNGICKLEPRPRNAPTHCVEKKPYQHTNATFECAGALKMCRSSMALPILLSLLSAAVAKILS